MRLTVIPVVIDVLGKRAGRARNQRMNRDHLNYTIVEIALNTNKGSGDLRRLGVTQTSVKNYQLNWQGV